MKKKLDLSTQVFGAGILLTHLHTFEAEIKGVRNSTDIEAVHRMRVASRRLLCTLPLFSALLPGHKSQLWLESLTSISNYLGATRDNDVQIEYLRNLAFNLPDEHYKPGINRLVLRLNQSSQKLKKKVLRSLDKIEDQAILQKLKKILAPWEKHGEEVYLYTPALYTLSHQAIIRRLDQFLSLEEFIFNPENVTEIHEMRMAAKWLRYTCETFTTLYANGLKAPLLALRQSQEILGNLRDCDVWIQYLPEFMQKEEKRSLAYSGSTRSYRSQAPGLVYILEQKQQERSSLYQSYLENWKQWQIADVWGELRQTIQTPFQQQENMSSIEDLSVMAPK